MEQQTVLPKDLDKAAIIYLSDIDIRIANRTLEWKSLDKLIHIQKTELQERAKSI